MNLRNFYLYAHEKKHKSDIYNKRRSRTAIFSVNGAQKKLSTDCSNLQQSLSQKTITDKKSHRRPCRKNPNRCFSEL